MLHNDHHTHRISSYFDLTASNVQACVSTDKLRHNLVVYAIYNGAVNVVDENRKSSRRRGMQKIVELHGSRGYQPSPLVLTVANPRCP